MRKVDGVGLKNFLRFRPVMPFLKDGQFEFSFVFGELCVNQRPAYIWLIFRANTKKSSGKKNPAEFLVLPGSKLIDSYHLLYTFFVKWGKLFNFFFKILFI